MRKASNLTKNLSSFQPKTAECGLKKLLELVECDLHSLGYQFSSWTAGGLSVVLAQETGLEVSEDCIRHALHQ